VICCLTAKQAGLMNWDQPIKPSRPQLGKPENSPATPLFGGANVSADRDPVTPGAL
jgi:hypothetical protein